MDSNQPDEKTLAMLMVIAGMIKGSNPGTGADHLTTMYERAIDDIRWRKAGAPQTPSNSSYQ